MLVEQSHILVPPVRLPERDVLAESARRSPLFDRAVRLAGLLGTGRPVDVTGILADEPLREAAAALGLRGSGYDDEAVAAWDFGLALGVIAIRDDEDGRPTAVPGDVLGTLDGLAADEVLALWRAGLDAVIGEAEFDDLLTGSDDPYADDPFADDPCAEEAAGPAPEWDLAGERAYLDAILRTLYLVAVLESWQPAAGGAPEPLPLPVLAAVLLTPDDPADHPGGTHGTDGFDGTDESGGAWGTDDLRGVEDADLVAEVAALADRLAALAPTGLLEYTPPARPLDLPFDGPLEDADPGEAAYGTVRLTALGLLVVRDRSLATGVAAPTLGDLRDAPATALLDVLPGYPSAAADAEADVWLAAREPAAAVAELLTAGVVGAVGATSAVRAEGVASATGAMGVASAERAEGATSGRVTPACLAVLNRLGGAAIPALRAAGADPALRPFAEAALADPALVEADPALSGPARRAAGPAQRDGVPGSVAPAVQHATGTARP
ncbi:hypothetical protein [Streptantibioticus silvisoli]|uniref:Uncharacterized protein n=1 Tax=Streptantibioticus silvisoli TaxID=2705255 RepID=A0ABT6WAG9_9ACTN|nr:hypothetical protein [Streptantibioticus silvisoli]MDI5967517.1 hypothetical protein [Streptantibioticus silvisoli]